MWAPKMIAVDMSFAPSEQEVKLKEGVDWGGG